MKVKIESPIGANTYEMSEENAVQLMLTAYRFADPDIPIAVDAHGAQFFKNHVNDIEHGSRNERLFGKRETWGGEKAEETEGAPAEETPEYEPGWKGFMILRCSRCGGVHPFFSRERITEHRCRCGWTEKFDDLIPAHVRCDKCGKYLKYRTNIRDDTTVTISCLECRAPIDLQTNERGTAMLPVSDIRNHAGGGIMTRCLIVRVRAAGSSCDRGSVGYG